MASEDEAQICRLRPAIPAAPFAVSLRITPDLLNELFQNVLAEGTAATIRFGDSASENVISVGKKSFHFTSFEEKGCDVYELLPECTHELQEAGTVLRKCNVQRQLNENEASRVKQRCVDSEALKKARKSVAIDQNSAVRLQTNPRRAVVTNAFKTGKS
eukprot:CAMPEP_0114294760 /NCGR_PEP_ID=MMETSP0059-20121206/10305_1 /TAXON_ID=36894 /ORGANISM="Pyramimonas parkeae, Strain CCMP726" /LENGTH=158 /DNA_ID=CAMNT_0001416573 /DNA_START=195 /DNA_END=668 /DNA_ORIENTATION=-